MGVGRWASVGRRASSLAARSALAASARSRWFRNLADQIANGDQPSRTQAQRAMFENDVAERLKGES